jgi:hypothetical protein
VSTSQQTRLLPHTSFRTFYRIAEWERLKGNKGRERTGRRREKRSYKEERKITEVEKKRTVNKKERKGED